MVQNRSTMKSLWKGRYVLKAIQSYHILAFNKEKRFQFFSDLANFKIPSSWFTGLSLHEKCPYSELFSSAFSRIQSEYREILLICLYSVQMRENADQNNRKYGRFLHTCFIWFRSKTKGRIDFWKGLVLNNWIVMEAALCLPLPSPPNWDG